MATKLGWILISKRRFRTQTSQSSPAYCSHMKWAYVMLCAIWYHLHNSKDVKNTHGGVLLVLKVALLINTVTPQ